MFRVASLLSLLMLTTVGFAQQPASRPLRSSEASGIDAELQYRIGIGDVLEIQVFNRPQLSVSAARVDGQGMIQMPMVENGITAVCRTETQLAQEIAQRYLKYQRNPTVTVFVKEFNSQPVAVIGAVHQPGRFQLQRRVRLLELIAFAGGPNERAGSQINIVRSPTSTACASTSATGVTAGDLLSLKLSDTLIGNSEANPYVQPGDVISVPEAEEAFVVGNVLRPSAIPLKQPTTASQAIAMAGGLMPDSKIDAVKLVRHSGPEANKEVILDLRAIAKKQAGDPILQAGDILDIPTSGGRRFLRTLVSSVAPAAANLPVRVVR